MPVLSLHVEYEIEHFLTALPSGRSVHPIEEAVLIRAKLPLETIGFDKHVQEYL